MPAAILGFVGALVFGAGDFIGGVASKRIGAMKVTFIAGLAGFVIAIIGSLVIPSIVTTEALFWGAMAGVVGSSAIMLLYASLAIGPMSILSPLGAFVSAIFPVMWAIVGGEAIGPLGFVGLGLGLVAVILVGFIPEKNAVRPSLKGISMAIGAGILIGAFVICIDQAPADAGLVPLISNRMVSATIMGSAILITSWMRRSRARRTTAGHSPSDVVVGETGNIGWRAGIGLALLCGLFDGTGNALLLLGIQIGDLSVMSVLTAMYPAGTILLAAIVLKERVAPIQALGLALAITAAAMLALA